MKSKQTYIQNIIIVLIIIFSYTIYNFVRLNKSSNIPFNEYSVFLSNFDGSECDNRILNIKNDKFNYNITVVNNTNENNDFILTTFIDYNQIPFNLKNTIPINSYKFSLIKHQQITVPIKINVNNYNKGTHKLNFIIYTNVNKISSNFKENLAHQAIITQHELIIKNDQSLKNPDVSFNNNNFYKSNKHNFILNVNNSSIKKDDLSKSLQIKARPDEIITLPTLMESFSHTNDYIFWLTLNYNQILIDSNLKYFYFKLPEGYAINRNTTFKAPHDKGIYQLTGFLSLNPYVKQY